MARWREQAKAPHQTHERALERLGYDWLERLGGGGMGVVYKVRNRDNGRIFAAKTVRVETLHELKPSVRRSMLDAFEAEAAMWMSLSPNPHDLENPDVRARGYSHIAYADSSPKDASHQFLILEFVEGETLDSLLERERYLSVAQAVDFGIQFCRGMIYCRYKRGRAFIHRDIKPSNMMVTRDRRLKIIDFGLSAAVGYHSGLTVWNPGTDRYMPNPPEGNSPQRDVYAFGVTLGELVAGSTWHQLARDLRALERRQPVPDQLVRIIARAMRPRREERYPDFETLLTDLEELQRHLAADHPTSCATCGYVANREAEACPLCGGSLAAPGEEVEAPRPTPLTPVPGLDPPVTPQRRPEADSPPPEPGPAPPVEGLVRIAAGSFTKGCDEHVADRIVREFGLAASNKQTLMKNSAERKRIDSDFLLARCAVSNSEYHRFVEDTGYHLPEEWRREDQPPYGAGCEGHPVVGVSWYDAAAYCRWAGGRLPTGDEWERGARGVDGRPYPWGASFDARRCNSAESNAQGPLPVDALEDGASPDGLLNMTGNVSEWTVPSRVRTGGLRGASFQEPCELYGVTVDTLRGADVDRIDPTCGFRVAADVAPGATSWTCRDMELVQVPGGAFVRGCRPEREAELNRIIGQFGASLPSVGSEEIVLGPFFIGKHPVTNQQYLAFVEATGWRRPQGWGSGRPFPATEENHPVVNVSYEDALGFCAWVGSGCRLPSGVEWERAARGGDERLYPWGDRFDAACCHSPEAGARGTAAVGSHPAGMSPFGVHDLVGNVWEWVDDYAQLRGGSFRQTCEIYGLSSFASEAQKRLQRDDVGFRLCRDA